MSNESWRFLAWVFIPLVALAIVVAAFGPASEDKPENDLRHAAFTVCKDYVKQGLRSPATAKFRNYFERDLDVVVEGSLNGPYVVRSTVDSQNGFGALVRSHFKCSVLHDDGRWTLMDLDIE